MSKLNINLDYQLPKESELTARELTYDYISHAVNKLYKDGIQGQLRRTWGRIQRKFDRAIDEKAEFIEIETAEMDIIKKAVEESAFPANIAKYIEVLEKEVERSCKE